MYMTANGRAQTKIDAEWLARVVKGTAGLGEAPPAGRPTGNMTLKAGITQVKAKVKRPKCLHVWRVKVELFLDIPPYLVHALSKRSLRDIGVVVEGANWPKAVSYCTLCGTRGAGLCVTPEKSK